MKLIQRTTLLPVALGLLGACGGAATVERTETQVLESDPGDDREQSLVQNDTPPPNQSRTGKAQN